MAQRDEKSFTERGVFLRQDHNYVPASSTGRTLANNARMALKGGPMSEGYSRRMRERLAQRMLSGAYNNRNESYKGSSPTAHK